MRLSDILANAAFAPPASAADTIAERPYPTILARCPA
jgi:hypothetical protein